MRVFIRCFCWFLDRWLQLTSIFEWRVEIAYLQCDDITSVSGVCRNFKHQKREELKTLQNLECTCSASLHFSPLILMHTPQDNVFSHTLGRYCDWILPLNGFVYITQFGSNIRHRFLRFCKKNILAIFLAVSWFLTRLVVFCIIEIPKVAIRNSPLLQSEIPQFCNEKVEGFGTR